MFTTLFIVPTAVLILVLLGLAYYLMPKKLRLPQLKKQTPQKNEREIRSVLLKQLQSLNELHTAMATIQVLVTGENDTATLGLFKKSNKMWLIRDLRTQLCESSYEFDSCFVQAHDFQFQKFMIPEAIGLALHDADFGVGSL